MSRRDVPALRPFYDIAPHTLWIKFASTIGVESGSVHQDKPVAFVDTQGFGEILGVEDNILSDRCTRIKPESNGHLSSAVLRRQEVIDELCCPYIREGIVRRQATHGAPPCADDPHDAAMTHQVRQKPGIL